MRRRQSARRRHAADAKVKGVDNAHLEAQQTTGATYDVEWVDIPEPDIEYDYTPGETAPTPNDTALVHVGNQGHAQGAAGFSRLEGQAYDNGVVYFTSTQGGGAAETGPDPIAGYGNGSGQVWAYDIKRRRADLPLPVAGPRRARLPRQRHHLQARDARGLRGQHRRQLHPRPDQATASCSTSP